MRLVPLTDVDTDSRVASELVNALTGQCTDQISVESFYYGMKVVSAIELAIEKVNRVSW